MAFLVRSLAVQSYASGITVWSYRAGDDTLDAIETPGFFADAQHLLSPGDVILVSRRDGGRVLFVTETGVVKAG